MLNRSALINHSFTVAVVALLFGHSAHAADGTWTLLSSGSATGMWSDALTANWSGGIVADGSGFTSDFSTLINISGTINGSGGITKSGGGTLTIVNNQTATYSGNTTLTGGGLVFGSNGALGTGTLTFGTNDAGVTMRSSSTASRTLGNALILAGNAGTNAITTLGSTNASFNGDLVFSNTGNIAMVNYSRKFSVYNRTEFAGAFTGNAGVGITMQTGTGTLVLSGASTYTGATTVSAGTLLVNGSLTSGSTVTINSGGTLGGTGTVGATSVLAGGILAPGNSICTMNFSQTLSLAGISNFRSVVGIVVGQ